MRPKKVILCVDSDVYRLSRRVFMLETRGYRVLRATSGDGALQTLRNLLPGTLACVVTELMMPRMDGNELVARVHALDPQVKTVITSESVSSFDRANFADAFLPKGECGAAELLERIKILVKRKRGPQPHGTSSIVNEIRASPSYARLVAASALQEAVSA